MAWSTWFLLTIGHLELLSVFLLLHSGVWLFVAITIDVFELCPKDRLER